MPCTLSVGGFTCRAHVALEDSHAVHTFRWRIHMPCTRCILGFTCRAHVALEDSHTVHTLHWRIHTPCTRCIGGFTHRAHVALEDSHAVKRFVSTKRISEFSVTRRPPCACVHARDATCLVVVCGPHVIQPCPWQADIWPHGHQILWNVRGPYQCCRMAQRQKWTCGCRQT